MVALVAGIAVAMYYGSKRPVDAPLTWGEASLGAVFVFWMMFLAYGIVPHQWLTYADGDLQWRRDAVAYVLRFWGRGQIIIPKETLRDIIAAGIYIVLLGVQIALWVLWQQRGRRKDQAAIASTSAYGRPLVKRP